MALYTMILQLGYFFLNSFKEFILIVSSSLTINFLSGIFTSIERNDSLKYPFAISLITPILLPPIQIFFGKMIHTEKILIGTLFSDVKDYVMKDFFKHVCKLTYPNIDICFVDNSNDKKYHRKMFNFFAERKKKSNLGKLTMLHTPTRGKDAEVFMAFSANELRKHFLKGNYDWLLNLECDIFPPLDIIERLLCFNKPVIGATYFSGDKSTPYPMTIELYLYNLKEGMFIDNPSYIKGFYEMTDSFEPKPYFGQGIGCVLIHRDIIQKIPFRTGHYGETFHDSVFYHDLMMNNIQNYLVPIICRHENKNWDMQRKMIGN